MTPDDRLRQALQRHAATIEPSSDGLTPIEEKLMDAQQSTHRNRILAGVAAAVVLIAVVAGVVLLSDDDEPDVTAGTTTTTESTTTTEPTTTTEESTTTTAAFDPTVDPAVPVFPDPLTSQRFDDPVPLAGAYATALGFREPILGPFQQGDSRSGEIEVRAFAQGDPTTLLVRQLEDDTWFVIGAVTASIAPVCPEAPITSPAPLAGEGYAFEGTIDVRLFADGTTEPIATGFVTGRGDGVPGAFEDELPYETAAEHGTLVYSAASGEDGSTIAASVCRVAFG